MFFIYIILFIAINIADPPVAKRPIADNAIKTGINGRKPPISGIGITIGMLTLDLLFSSLILHVIKIENW